MIFFFFFVNLNFREKLRETDFTNNFIPGNGAGVASGSEEVAIKGLENGVKP